MPTQSTFSLIFRFRVDRNPKISIVLNKPNTDKMISTCCKFCGCSIHRKKTTNDYTSRYLNFSLHPRSRCEVVFPNYLPSQTTISLSSYSKIFLHASTMTSSINDLNSKDYCKKRLSHTISCRNPPNAVAQPPNFVYADSHYNPHAIIQTPPNWNRTYSFHKSLSLYFRLSLSKSQLPKQHRSDGLAGSKPALIARHASLVNVTNLKKANAYQSTEPNTGIHSIAWMKASGIRLQTAPPTSSLTETADKLCTDTST